ncbi:MULTISPECIES: hypothetical protein [Photorhabdus]|uniref:Uncharacterized protein n=2 Tax=Photorhabdus TaxID=29487 RepID=A0ABX0B199_9GAMM|nr:MULTISPECIES: hypothetical protein [Photorhabdus]MCC8375386.1 hypothetical protein [Photorhabdus bodei]MCC8464628.1 hypothetical protein [Photorhabdus bodei]MCT8352130.1 hypothetical protein [Photorhabdus kayaii]MDB6367951.1 hypothetical protein [Photorhabdus bodei]MDB6371729.1 hypothetical protein [Photorhabdus bodei]
MTGVSECSQQRDNLKDDGYNSYLLFQSVNKISEQYQPKNRINIGDIKNAIKFYQ